MKVLWYEQTFDLNDIKSIMYVKEDGQVKIFFKDGIILFNCTPAELLKKFRKDIEYNFEEFDEGYDPDCDPYHTMPF